MKLFKIVYNSFIWAMTIAILCFKSEWLQMRVNTGYIFGGLLILFNRGGVVCFQEKGKRV